MAQDEMVHVRREALIAFCAQVFEKLGLTQHAASVSADVLVAADARGRAATTSQPIARIRVDLMKSISAGPASPAA